MTPSEFFSSKTTLPTDLRTRELSRLPLWLKEQSFFMAGVANETILSGFREAAQKVISGELSEAEATRLMRDALKKGNYQAGDGHEGTIKDLTTLRRQLTTLRANVALAQGWATEAKQMQASEAYPAKELYRFSAAKHPRPWQTKLWPSAVAKRNAAHPDLAPLSAEVMMAPLGDPIWPALSDFGAPYDPLKYGTKMRQRAVGWREWQAVQKAEKLKTETLKEEAPTEEGTAAPSSIAHRPLAITSPGENVELKLELNPPDKARVKQTLGGLAEWQGDTLIFTDPNGTRPYAPAELAPIILAPNVDGTPNYQLAALQEWQALGGDENALAEMRRLHAGADMLEDFNRLVYRLQRGRAGIAALQLLVELAAAIAL